MRAKICAARALRLAVAAIAMPIAAVLVPGSAGAQFLGRVFVDHSKGPNGAIIVYNLAAPLSPYYQFLVPQASGYPEEADPVVSGPVLQGIRFTSSDGTVHFVEFGNFQEVNPSTSAIDAKASSPLVSTAVSNDADAFASTCDNRLTVVVGYSTNGTPVSLVDETAGREVVKLSYPNMLARAVAVGDDGQTALVVLDSAMGSGASSIRRLAIGATGTLADTGDQLAFAASDFVSKVAIAPGSRSGAALVASNAGGGTRLVSFTMPGLVIRDSVNLAANAGNAIAFNSAATRIYARSGSQAAAPDVIQGFSFDRTSGALGHVAALTIGNVSGFTGSLLNNPMAIAPDDSVLVATEEDARGELPAPRITEFSTTTGAVTGTFTYGGLSTPQTVATARACSVGPAAGAFNANQHGLTGSWYQPATSGQGIEVEIFPDLQAPGTGTAQVSWFTFDAISGGADHQRWYTLGGAVPTGPSASLTIYQNVGGNFNALPITSAQVVGNATLGFDSCSSGTLVYSFTDGSGRSGSIPLTRLTQNVTCSSSGTSTTHPDFALSGNWYDPTTSGQGITVEVNPVSAALFFAWYTYAPAGANAGAAGQRWYTGQGAFVPGARSIAVQLYETTGGAFNATAPVPSTAPVGVATLSFQSCTQATLRYSFTAGSSNGLSGSIALSRIGPVPPGCTS